MVGAVGGGEYGDYTADTRARVSCAAIVRWERAGIALHVFRISKLNDQAFSCTGDSHR